MSVFVMQRKLNLMMSQNEKEKHMRNNPVKEVT